MVPKGFSRIIRKDLDVFLSVLAELTGGQEETAAPSGQTVYWDRSKRVITKADLQGLGQAVVIIPAGARLTDVAREYAIARKIDIQMEKSR